MNYHRDFVLNIQQELKYINVTKIDILFNLRNFSLFTENFCVYFFSAR